MNWRLIFFGVIAGMVAACQNIEDADIADRKTFVRFYQNEVGQLGILAEPVDDGFIVLANSFSESNLVGYLIKTDTRGNTQWKTTLDGTFRGMALGSDGYFVFGDSIKINPNAEEVADLIVNSSVLYKINFNGNIDDKITLKADTVNKIDFKSNAITLNDQNQVILLGTFRSPASKERPYLVSLTTSFDTVWTKGYDIIDRDYVNAKSIHSTGDGHVIWASAILKEQQNFSRSYLAIPYVLEGSVFENNDLYGETTDQKLTAADIQPAYSKEFGFGVIGSQATPTGENSNFFFARVTKQGDIVDGSVKYFDGNSESVLVDMNTSTSEDEGTAICATRDGGFALAGTQETLPGFGNGGKDILLIKVDALGNVLWKKTFGGSNDDVVNSIRETEDGGLILCGSVDATGLPAIMVIKTDQNGEIKD